jgi:hypothetical protein
MRLVSTILVTIGCLSIVFIPYAADGAVTVTGKVLKLPNHRPAAGYPVIMYPDSIQVLTDSEGRYTIASEELGKILVVKNDDQYIPCALKRISELMFVESSPGAFYMRPIELAFTPKNAKPKVWKTSGVVTDLDDLGSFDPPCRLASGLVKLEVEFAVEVDETGELKEATDGRIVWKAGSHPDPAEVQMLIEEVKKRLSEIEFTPDTDEFCRPTPAEIKVLAKLKYDSAAGWTFSSRLKR